MGYASLTTSNRGIVRKNVSMQCLGVDIARVTSTDQAGNITVLSEVRTPVVSKTVETVKEFVGLDSTTANGSGPAATSHGETGANAYLFVPFCRVNAMGQQPFVEYERNVSVVREQGGTFTVTVTERDSVILT